MLSPGWVATLCVLVAALAGVALSGFDAYHDRLQSLGGRFRALELAVVEQSQLEWQAVAEHGISDELADRIEQVRAQIFSARSDPQPASAAASDHVLDAVDEYMEATGAEIAALRAGDLEAAEQVDEARVDPAYATLRTLLEAEGKSVGEREDRAEALMKYGIYTVLLLAALLIGGLLWRFGKARTAAREALFDPLTGLANRTLLGRRLSEATAEADSRFAVLFIDIDEFKRINDTLGHAIGDGVVRAVADRLSSAARDGDTLARLGGDEFALIARDVGSVQGAEAAVARIAGVFAEPFAVGEHCLRVRATIGYVLAETGLAPDDLLRNADLAMYAGKREGKDRAVQYDPSMYEALADRVALEADVRRAVQRGEIHVAYQPIFRVADGAIYGFEALARWRHPSRGRVAPMEFIPLAEEIGVIDEIGSFVLGEACRRMAKWRSLSPSANSLVISVNVSPVQLMGDRLMDDVRAALEASALDPSALTLEVTESVLVERSDALGARLEALRASGVMIAMDDFGTGYSSLASLTQLPVDTLKIDRSFVREMHGTGAGAAVVRSVVDLGTDLGLNTVAEGIESEEQLEALSKLGCDLGQGFYFARPMGDDDVAAMIVAGSEIIEALGT